MDMTTRLQVEHPVSRDGDPGLDLVELQLQVAAGGLCRSRRAFRCRGHAVEARLMRKIPIPASLPSTGQLTQLDLADAGPSASIAGWRQAAK